MLLDRSAFGDSVNLGSVLRDEVIAICVACDLSREARLWPESFGNYTVRDTCHTVRRDAGVFARLIPFRNGSGESTHTDVETSEACAVARVAVARPVLNLIVCPQRRYGVTRAGRLATPLNNIASRWALAGNRAASVNCKSVGAAAFVVAGVADRALVGERHGIGNHSDRSALLGGCLPECASDKREQDNGNSSHAPSLVFFGLASHRERLRTFAPRLPGGIGGAS